MYLFYCSIIDNKEGEVTLYPSTNEEAQTFVNGTLLSSPTVLHHSDRLVIAGDHFFRFNHPLQVKQGGVGRKGGVGGKNFEYARDEFIKAQTERLEVKLIYLNIHCTLCELISYTKNVQCI